jgi:hypothetical protein
VSKFFTREKKTMDQAKGGHSSMTDVSNILVQPQKVGSIVEANFPKDAEGRVYHLAAKRGEGVFHLFSHIDIMFCNR